MEREEKFSYTEDTSRSLLSIKQGLSLRQFLEEGSHETRRFIKACYASSLLYTYESLFFRIIKTRHCDLEKLWTRSLARNMLSFIPASSAFKSLSLAWKAGRSCAERHPKAYFQKRKPLHTPPPESYQTCPRCRIFPSTGCFSLYSLPVFFYPSTIFRFLTIISFSTLLYYTSI